jgi:hypothetical protein
MSSDANVVRLDRDLRDVLREFPANRILYARTPADQVAVTHRGETTIYESPEALAEAMREHDPRAAEQRLLIDAAVDRARELVTLAEEREADARELFARAQTQLLDAIEAHRLARRFRRAVIIAAAAGVGFALLAYGGAL